MVRQALAKFLCMFSALSFGFAELGFAADSFKLQAESEFKAGRAACEKFKKDFAPLEAEKRVKGQKVLKQAADIEKAIALIDAKEVSTAKRTELREEFFKNPKPTRTDVGVFLAVEGSNCMFPVFSALAGTIETAGTTSDAILKEKTRGMLKRWFEASEKNAENVLSVGTTKILFERALAGGVLKGSEKDHALIKEIAKTVREKSEESAKKYRSLVYSDIDEEKEKVEKIDFEKYKFDPMEMQSYLIADRETAKSLNARLKSWLAER